jgi:hypothetical protein
MSTDPQVPFETDVIDRLARIEEHVTSVKVRADDHEGRIRSMEKRQWLLVGVAAAIAPLLSKLNIHLPILG